MRNRAKCRLCQDIIESFHTTDYVSCKCDEISVSGGASMHCASNDWKNFIRVDDEDHEIEVRVKDKAPIEAEEIQPNQKPNKEELIQMLDEMRKRYETLPAEAMYAPVTHADFTALMMLLSAILQSE